MLTLKSDQLIRGEALDLRQLQQLLINALGGNVVEEETALHITPAPLHAGVFHTYEDHRLATAGAVLGLVFKGIEVENIATTRKTLPDFPGL